MKLDSAKDLFDAVQPLATGNEASIKGKATLFPGQARRAAGLAFMQMVMALEDLIEAAFIRYIAGAPAPNGTAPNLRLGAAENLQHAYQLLSGNPSHRAGIDYLTWSDWSATIKLSKVFFVDGAPFSSLTHLEKDRLRDATKIRNRVAHFSDKCRKDFNEVARTHLGLGSNDKLRKGHSVGDLLIVKSPRCFGKNCGNKFYFDHYHQLFQAVAQKICPK